MTSGQAFVYLFPFEIHIAEACRQPRRLRYHDGEVTFYPPFTNAEGLRVHRDVDLASLPRRPGTRPPETVLPQLQIPGKPGWKTHFRLADALRIDVYNVTDPELVASKLTDRVVRLCRLWSRQWWITRGASESLRLLHARFDVDPIGQPVNRQVHGIKHIAPWLGTETLIDDALFARCCADAVLGIDIPTSLITLYDAIWYSTHDERDSALLNMAIACEAAFSEEALRAVKDGKAKRGTVRQAINGRGHSFMYRIDRDAELIFGSSFKGADAEAFARLGAVWRARQVLAHGNASGARRFVTDEYRAWLTGGLAFFEWLSHVRDRDANDPMRAVAHPFYRRSA
jgi:hypothetical protein